MGWASAGSIIDPILKQLIRDVEREEVTAGAAQLLTSQLIANLQRQDWDTESETLEQFMHVSWIVKAFAANGVTPTNGERPTREQIKNVVRLAIDSQVESWYDLSDDFTRNVHADKITDAVLALFPET